MNLPSFEPRALPPQTQALRERVRSFLSEALRDVPAAQRAATWMGYDPEFSRAVAAQGWIGMTWPKRYGGGEASAFDRFVVLEELLAAGAPAAAHWITDRQVGPLLLRFGTETQREQYLPAICRAELFCCIGMSEPGSGSDLASVRTRAIPCEGGYSLNGTKLWTSGAAISQAMVALVRTAPPSEDRHAGLSQLWVDLAAPGVSVRPIRDLSGRDHFCEVHFEDVFVPTSQLIGEAGAGWSQVMAELAYERSGPERYLSCQPLFEELLRVLPSEFGSREAVEVGRLAAHLATLRQLSISVAGRLADGEDPALEAAVVKDLGAVYEQSLPGRAQSLVGFEANSGESATDYEAMLAFLLQNAPSFSLRGGTREILRGIIARGLGLR